MAGVEVQNQVGRSLRGNLARLRDVLDGAVSQGIGSLGQVADRVCEAFDFHDGRGRWQRASWARLWVEPLEWFVLTTLPVTSTGCAKLPPIHHVRLGLSALGRRPGRDG